MFKNKKRLIYIGVTVLIVIAVAVGVITILNSANNNSSKTHQTSSPSKATADSLKAQALKAMLANNTAKAKTLFEQAREQYKSLNNQEGVIDTEAQLYLINHPATK